MEPYKWQKSCLKEWEKEKYIGSIEAVTGSGKTYLAVFALNYLKEFISDITTFVVVPRVALAHQWRAVFLKCGFTINEIAVQNKCIANFQKSKIIIFVINTARYELSKLILKAQNEKRHVLLIADEYHHFFSKENKHVFDFADSINFKKNKYSYLGISATPINNLPNHFTNSVVGRIFFRYKLEEALRDNIVSPFAIYNIKVNFSTDEAAEYDEISEKIRKSLRVLYSKFPMIKQKKDFKEYIVSIRKIASEDEIPIIEALTLLLFKRREIISNAEQRVDCALHLIKTLKTNSRIIIFCERIEQCDLLFSKLNTFFPNSIAKYHSCMDKEMKSKNLLDFRKNNKRILIACKALDEGIDIPSAEVGIFLSNTDSELQRIQRLGRLIRKQNGKEIADLYYIYVKNTIEFPLLLHNTPSFVHSISLSYRNGKIENHYYNRALFKVLKNISTKVKLDQNRKQSIYNAAVHGAIHHDYLLDNSELDKKISTAKSVAIKNYYMLAKAIHKYI